MSDPLKIYYFGGSNTHSLTCLKSRNYMAFSLDWIDNQFPLCFLIPQMDKSGSPIVGSSHFKALPAVTSEQAHLWNGVYSNFFPNYEVQKSSSYFLAFCCFPYQIICWLSSSNVQMRQARLAQSSWAPPMVQVKIRKMCICLSYSPRLFHLCMQ